MLATLIEEINLEFEATPIRIDRLQQSKLRLIAYEMIAGMGGLAIGKVATRELIAQLLRHAGMKIVAKYSAKIVPLPGSLYRPPSGCRVLFQTH